MTMREFWAHSNSSGGGGEQRAPSYYGTHKLTEVFEPELLRRDLRGLRCGASAGALSAV